MLVVVGVAVLGAVSRFGSTATVLWSAAGYALVVLAAHSLGAAGRPLTLGEVTRTVAALAVGDVDEHEFNDLSAAHAGINVVHRIAIDTRSDDVRASIQAADEAAELVRDGTVEAVVIVGAAPGFPAVNAMIRRLAMQDIGVEVITGAACVAPSRVTVGQLGRFATLRVEPKRHGRVAHWAKRAFDVAFSGLTILVTLPLLAIIAAAIRLDSPGPVFYRQSRLGRQGRQFEIWKFRSMIIDADQLVIDLTDENSADGPLFKIRHDPRVTRVGRLLRRWSLDELPQLLNVLRGDMSLVGPRPALPSEADGWSPELFDRLLVRPGLTGPWQVSGRSDASFEEYSRLDLYYVDNWSMTLDLEILARTLPAIMSGDGAY